MSTEPYHQNYLITTNEPSDTLSTTTIFGWLQDLQTPPTSSYKPSVLEALATPSKERYRSLSPIPSEFLGDGSSFYKRRKALQEVGDQIGRKDMFGLPTPSYEASSSGSSRPPSQLNAISSSATTSNTNPHTPNKRQKTKENQGQIGFQMSLNGLLMEDFDAFEEASDIKRYVEELIDDPRGSTMKAASLKKARETARVYKCVTEATFLYHMIPILQGNGYHVDVKPEFKPGEEELSRQEDTEWKSFLSDEKIIVTLNQDFSRTLLPSKLSQNPVLVKGIAEELAKDTGMTNPRPDLTYSIQRDVRALTADTSIPEHILDLIEVSPGGHHTILIIEGKNHGA